MYLGIFLCYVTNNERERDHEFERHQWVRVNEGLWGREGKKGNNVITDSKLKIITYILKEQGQGTE